MRRDSTLTILILLSALMAAPIVFPLTSLGSSSYDPLDSHLFLWNFWWTRTAIGELRNPYWTDLLLYPRGASLTLHSFPLPYNLVSVPFQRLVPGITGSVVAFNAIALASFVLSGLGAYWLALRATSNRQAALIAGLIFACMPYRFLNVARLHLLATEFLAASVLAWIRFTDAPTRARAVMVGVALAATTYSSPEYALAALGVAVLWMMFHWRARPGARSRALAAHVALAIGVLALLTLPLLVGQVSAMARGDVRASRSIGELVAWSPALVSFVTPSRMHPVYGGTLAWAGESGTPGIEGMRSETTIGLTVWFLAIIAARRMTRDSSLFWALSAGVFLVLTLGPYLRLTGTIMTGIPMPYRALYALVPPLRASRDPTRLLPAAMLMLSVLAAFGARACLGRVHGRLASAGVTGLLTLLVLFEGLSPWPSKVASAALVPAGYDRIAEAAGDFAVVDLTEDQLALLAQTRHGHPITGGRLAVPRSADAHPVLPLEDDLRHLDNVAALEPAARAVRLAADRQMLDQLHVRFVVFPDDGIPEATLLDALELREVNRAPATYEVSPVRFAGQANR